MSERYKDEELLDFLQSLDNSEVEVGEWEAKFVESNLDAISFSPRQREVINSMIEKYGKRIAWL